VVEHLTPLGDHQGERGLSLPGSVHQETDEAGRGQGAAVGGAPDRVHAIAILRRQKAVEGHLGGSPPGPALVVAGAVVGAVPLRGGHAGRRIPRRTKALQGGTSQGDSLRVRLAGQFIDVLEAAGEQRDRG